MQGQVAVAAQRDQVLLGVIPGLTAKFLPRNFLGDSSRMCVQ